MLALNGGSVMDDATNEVLGKLTREGAPITFDRYRYEIEDLEAQLEAIEAARKSGKVKLISRVLRRPIDKRAEGLREAIGALRKEGRIEGVLTQLKEKDVWECRTRYTVKRLYHQRLADKELLEDKDYMAAHAEGVDVVGVAVLLAAQVTCSLKKKDKVNGEWVRMFTFDEISEMDPKLHAEIWSVYRDHLMVTQAELKKSSASTTATSQARTQETEKVGSAS